MATLRSGESTLRQATPALPGSMPRCVRTRDPRLTSHEKIVARVSAVLFDGSPIGLNFGFNTDEYDSEAEPIVSRLLDGVPDLPALQSIVHETFVEAFDLTEAGAVERYHDVSTQIWEAWSTYRPRSEPRGKSLTWFVKRHS